MLLRRTAMRHRDRNARLALLLFACTALIAACTPNLPGDPSVMPEGSAPAAPYHLYTDTQVLELLQEYPGLDAQFEPEPENVLEIIGIDLRTLEQTELYVGDCICVTIYNLSPGYELVVDNNACSGYDVYIRMK